MFLVFLAAVHRVQFGSPRIVLNPIISDLDKHAVMLPVYYTASVLPVLSLDKIGKEFRQAPQAFSLRFAQHATGQTSFNPGFSASLSILVVIILPLISSKSVASIFGKLAEDSI